MRLKVPKILQHITHSKMCVLVTLIALYTDMRGRGCYARACRGAACRALFTDKKDWAQQAAAPTIYLCNDTKVMYRAHVRFYFFFSKNCMLGLTF